MAGVSKRERSGIYLDWNATTPPSPAVLEAMAQARERYWANPSSVHTSGRAARAIIEGVRETLAKELGAHARDVVFTSGGTEANNLALSSGPGIVTSRLEHPSVTRVAEAVADSGRPVRWLPPTSEGHIEPGQLARALEGMPEGTRVAVMAANHETGVLEDLEPLAEVARAHGAWLHCDITQAFGKVSPELYAAADSLTIAAHKFRGPKGIGALAWRRAFLPAPVLRGGAQERGVRPGTQDASLAAGLGAALAELGPLRDSYRALASVRDRLEQELVRFAEINGGSVPRLPHVSNASFRDWSGDELVAALDLAGVQVSSGSACSAGTQEPSPVIQAMLNGQRARSAVRFSMGPSTTPEQIEQTIVVLNRVVTKRSSSTSSIT